MANPLEKELERDEFCTRERWFIALCVWFAVYVSVVCLNWLLPDMKLPMPVEAFMTTILTVPLMTFVVSPLAERYIRKSNIGE